MAHRRTAPGEHWGNVDRCDRPTAPAENGSVKLQVRCLSTCLRVSGASVFVRMFGKIVEATCESPFLTAKVDAAQKFQSQQNAGTQKGPGCFARRKLLSRTPQRYSMAWYVQALLNYCEGGDSIMEGNEQMFGRPRCCLIIWIV